MDICPSLSAAEKWRYTEVQKLDLRVQKLVKLELETERQFKGVYQFLLPHTLPIYNSI